jgi:hypothetical protein
MYARIFRFMLGRPIINGALRFSVSFVLLALRQTAPRGSSDVFRAADSQSRRSMSDPGFSVDAFIGEIVLTG